MELDLAVLPDDPALCHEIINALAGELKGKDKLVEKLRLQIEQLCRHRFGQRSEHFNPSQNVLGFAWVEVDQSTTPEATPLATPGDWTDGTDEPAVKAKGAHGRSKLPKNLPRARVVYDPPKEKTESCAECGLPMKKFGEEITTLLGFIPASAYIKELVRPKLCCSDPTCSSKPIIAAMPPRAVPKGSADAGMLAHVVLSKFGDHLPLYRLRDILKRHGITIAESTLGDWCEQVAKLFGPLYETLKKAVLASQVLQTDDTPIAVREPGEKETHKGHLWAYLGDRTARFVFYDYSPDWKGEHPQHILRDFKNKLVSDMYPGYCEVCGPGKATACGCNAHARRYFDKVKSTAPAICATALSYYQKLYRIEKEAADLDDDARRELRQKKAKPIWDEYKLWLERQRGLVDPSGGVADAIKYAQKHWVALTHYLDDGAVPIDNNACERRLREIGTGRRNWIALGSDEGGHRAAVLYSIVQSAKMHGLDPFKYLQDLLERLPTHPEGQLAELLPDRWKPVPADQKIQIVWLSADEIAKLAQS